MTLEDGNPIRILSSQLIRHKSGQMARLMLIIANNLCA